MALSGVQVVDAKSTTTAGPLLGAGAAAVLGGLPPGANSAPLPDGVQVPIERSNASYATARTVLLGVAAAAIRQGAPHGAGSAPLPRGVEARGGWHEARRPRRRRTPHRGSVPRGAALAPPRGAGSAPPPSGVEAVVAVRRADLAGDVIEAAPLGSVPHAADIAPPLAGRVRAVDTSGSERNPRILAAATGCRVLHGSARGGAIVFPALDEPAVGRVRKRVEREEQGIPGTLHGSTPGGRGGVARWLLGERAAEGGRRRRGGILKSGGLASLLQLQRRGKGGAVDVCDGTAPKLFCWLLREWLSIWLLTSR